MISSGEIHHPYVCPSQYRLHAPCASSDPTIEDPWSSHQVRLLLCARRAQQRNSSGHNRQEASTRLWGTLRGSHRSRGIARPARPVRVRFCVHRREWRHMYIGLVRRAHFATFGLRRGAGGLRTHEVTRRERVPEARGEHTCRGLKEHALRIAIVFRRTKYAPHRDARFSLIQFQPVSGRMKMPSASIVTPSASDSVPVTITLRPSVRSTRASARSVPNGVPRR